MPIVEPVGVILAGGAGRRMGGVSKASVLLGGKTLLTWTEDRLSPQVRDVVINSAEALDTRFPLVPDLQTEKLGPLAGVAAGLSWAKAQRATHIVTVPVDTPFLPCDLVPRLILAAEANGHGLAVAATEDGLQGAFGLWPVSLLSALTAFLDDCHRKVRDFTSQNHAAEALFPTTQPDSFFNINTPEDLAQAEQWL